MPTVTQPNIYSEFCIEVIIQGTECPFRSHGKSCPYAHTKDEIAPRVCEREVEEPVCWSRNYNFPFKCKCIHRNEDVDEYAKRLGFDPAHTDYDKSDLYGLHNEIEECNKQIGKLMRALNEIHADNTFYIKRTNRYIKYLTAKIYFLNNLIHKKEKEHSRWLKREAYEDRRDKWRQQFLERDDDE